MTDSRPIWDMIDRLHEVRDRSGITLWTEDRFHVIFDALELLLHHLIDDAVDHEAD